MPVWNCNYAEADEIEVVDTLDEHDDLQISINPQSSNAHVYLSVEDAEAFAMHILHVIGKDI